MGKFLKILLLIFTLSSCSKSTPQKRDDNQTTPEPQEDWSKVDYSFSVFNVGYKSVLDGLTLATEDKTINIVTVFNRPGTFHIAFVFSGYPNCVQTLKEYNSLDFDNCINSYSVNYLYSQNANIESNRLSIIYFEKDIQGVCDYFYFSFSVKSGDAYGFWAYASIHEIDFMSYAIPYEGQEIDEEGE